MEGDRVMIRLIVDGEPVPQARPRVTRHGAYDPPKCKAYKEQVALTAKVAMRGLLPSQGPIACHIHVYRGIPKSWSRAKRGAAQAGNLLPTSKPDTDNYLKGIMDGLTGIAWVDDSQVIRVTCEKSYSEQPRAVIEIREIA